MNITNGFRTNATMGGAENESSADDMKENLSGGGRSSSSFRRKKSEYLSNAVMKSLNEDRQENKGYPTPTLVTEEQLTDAFEVINSLETYVEAGEADPDFVEQFVPEELAVIVKGLAETAGFEETLLDDTQQEAVDFEEAVPGGVQL